MSRDCRAGMIAPVAGYDPAAAFLPRPQAAMDASTPLRYQAMT